jgi:L-arabinose isomerase
MSDDADDNGPLEVTFEPEESRSEVYEWSNTAGKGGTYIFPRGVEEWAEANGIEVVHIDQTTGVVTVQHELGSPFRQIDKPLGGSVKSIK